MSRIYTAFKDRKALIAYVTVGYPDVETTLKVVPLLTANGADLIELGIPFSDPLADGVTIQNASFHALQNGVTAGTCLQVARELSKTVTVPLVFMTYYNPVFNYGLKRFCAECAASGVSGLIIPDLPPEEGTELEACSQGHSIDIIYLLSPTSTASRIKLVSEKSRGFIYLVSLTGVTGARQSISSNLGDFITRVRQVARQPLAVGFGISTPQQAKDIAGMADGVIIGSRIIQLMEADPSLNAVGEFIKELRTAIDAG